MSFLRPYSPDTPFDERPEITPGHRTMVRWLDQPIDPERATVNRIAWDRYEARWMNVCIWGMALSGLSIVAMMTMLGLGAMGVLSLRPETPSSMMDLMAVPMVLACIGATVMTIPGVMVMMAQHEKACFTALNEQFQGEFWWLLARTPSGQRLRGHLTLHPRPPLAGELEALQRAHREAGAPQAPLEPGEAYRDSV